MSFCMITSALLSCLLCLPCHGAEHGPGKKDLDRLVQAMPSGTTAAPVAIPWRLFVPDGADGSAGASWPLVVFLHGADMRGKDNLRPMRLAWPFWSTQNQQAHPCFVFAAQCPKRLKWSAIPAGDKDGGGKGNCSVEPEPEATLAAVLATMDELIASHPIDRQRIYLVGLSMGGYGTWDALYRRPQQWAAAVPICGGGDPAQVHRYKDTPIWIWHGAQDPTVAVQNSRDMKSALEAAGGSPRYTELADAAHNSWGPAFASQELHAWLFAQRRVP